MKIEEKNFEKMRQDSPLVDVSVDNAMLEDTERNSSLANMENNFNSSNKCNEDVGKMNLSSAISSVAIAYGLHKLSDLPAIKEVVDNCKASISDSFSDFGHRIGDFFSDIYEGLKGLIASNDADTKTIEKLGGDFVEERDFGLDKCTEAAEKIFNPGVIEHWADLSMDQRREIAGAYAAEVADAFELQNFTGVYFEDLESGTYGYNNGDGSIHLSNELIKAWTSPLDIMSTITHELRHQYQFEAVHGYHNVSAEVVNEWATAYEMYNYDQPYCYDPWGYTYNPLEIDARYAGESVVRNVTHDMINA